MTSERTPNIFAAFTNVLSKALSIVAKGQVEKVTIPRASNGGMYLVKLTGANSKIIYIDKIAVQ